MASCSQENELTTDNDTQVETPTLRSAKGKYRVLGFSYDVTGDNLNKKSVRRPVLDIDKMELETKHTLIVDPETGGENHFYYGYSSLDYVKEVSRKTGFNASVFGVDFNKLNLCGFGGNIIYNSEFDSKYSYSSKYSFATADITKYVNTLRIAETPQNLLKYLSAKFLSDLNSTTFNADQFVLDYGTHVLTDITMGGHLQIICRSSIVEESDYTRKKEILKAGLNGALKMMKLSASIDKETEIKETIATQNKEATVYIKYKAGTGVGGTYNVETGVPTIDKGTWEQSVTPQNAGLVEINWNKAYPIYDFITDVNKKAAVKAAVIRYIASKQIEVMQLKPFYKMYSPASKNSYYLQSWDEVIRNISQYGYIYESLDGYILAASANNTRPLYKMYSPGPKNSYYLYSWDEVMRHVSRYGDKYEGTIDGYIYEPN